VVAVVELVVAFVVAGPLEDAGTELNTAMPTILALVLKVPGT